MAASKKWQLSPLEYNIDLLTTPVLFFAGLFLAPVSLPKLVLGALVWSIDNPPNAVRILDVPKIRELSRSTPS